MLHYATTLLASAVVCATASADITWTGDVAPANPATWNGGTTAYVGDNSAGSLTVDGSSNLIAYTAYIGLNEGAPGEVGVIGPGASWEVETGVAVGGHASGTVRVQDGATVASDTLGLFCAEDATSLVVIDGAGSAWDARAIGLGGSGESTLTITQGGQVTTDRMTISRLRGSKGRFIIDGPGSSLTTRSLDIAYHGVAELSITNGAQVENDSVQLGTISLSQGRVVVSNPGSTWTNQYQLSIGYNGAASLAIADGGLVTVAANLSIPGGYWDDNSISIASGGMLALAGEADDSIEQFLDFVDETDSIRYWNSDIGNWAHITEAAMGEDYTLQYVSAGELAGFTLLTVNAAGPPGDFDDDLDVDGADLLAWQRDEPLIPGSAHELVGWQTNYGLGTRTLYTSVPEPAAIVMAVMASALAAYVPLRCRSQSSSRRRRGGQHAQHRFA